MLSKPNILFICTDQQRWDTLGKYKPENLQTPNLDKLLAKSLHLPNTFCQAPVCIPSRACMLTGQYPSQTGIYHNTGTLANDKTTWASELSANGYETICIGRSHGINQGFSHVIPIPFGDSFFDMSSTINKKNGKWTYGHDNFSFLPHIYEGDFENYMDVRCANTACHALHDLKDSHKPWAMYLGFLAPHNPYIIPEKYSNFYKENDFDFPMVFDEDFNKPFYTPDRKEFWDKFSEEDITKTRCFYYSMVTFVDELIGRVLDKLEMLGLIENTIIILTSDHGEMNGDHGLWAKINFYDQSMKIPFLISYPSLLEGYNESEALIESVDFMPTILELAGINIPSSVAGKSIKSILEKKKESHKSYIYSAFNEGGSKNKPARRVRCIRTLEYCYSYGYTTNSGITGELYDLKKDPFQRYNIYDNPEYQQVRQNLMKKLLEHEIEYSYSLHSEKKELAWNKPPSQHLY